MNTRYTPPSHHLFQLNRKRLCDLLPEGALAIVHAHDLMPTNADSVLPFKQNSNLYYLSGIDQAETILLLFPSAQESSLREVLFTPSTTPETEIWEGEQLSTEASQRLSGIENIRPTDTFESTLSKIIGEVSVLYLETNEHYRAQVTVETRNARFIQWCKEKYPLHRYERLAPLMAELRAIKSEEEIKQLRKACDITGEGFARALQVIRPDIKEYAIEAAYLETFVSQGARGFAFTPIIASGRNACTLHYTQNAATCQENTLVLMDVGAEYGNYCADMTRCAPVSGRFSKRQRKVYEAVLSVQKYAKKCLKPGVLLQEYQKKVEEAIEEALCQLGLLKTTQLARHSSSSTPAYKKYFMHGVSHHLGLDVHDIPLMRKPLEAGMVLTVEPGIYIREEGIGIRLENDVLIKKDGTTEDLMKNIPIEIEEIEEIMQQNKNTP